MNNDGGSAKHGNESRPLGRVVKANEDGTVLMEVDMNNPVAANIVATAAISGIAAANDVLKAFQQAKKN